MKRVFDISDYEPFSDYAELLPWEDQERFAMTTTPTPRMDVGSLIVGALFGMGMIGFFWLFIWAAVGGYRTFHHLVDRIIQAFS
jgi:hypothetical protein